MASQFGSDMKLVHVDGTPLCTGKEPSGLAPPELWPAGHARYIPGKGDPALGGLGGAPVPITEEDLAGLQGPHPAEGTWHYSQRSGRFPWGVLGLFIMLAACVALALVYVFLKWPVG